MPSTIEPKMDVSIATVEAVNLIKTIVLGLVDHPAQVEVFSEVEPHNNSTVIHVNSDPKDTGKLVGKQGRTVRSIRTILSGNSMRVGYRFSLDIIETDRGNHDHATSRIE